MLTIAGTTSDDFLAQAGIDADPADDPESAFADVAAGRADAFVYDAAIVRYLAPNYGGVGVVGPVLKPESYGIALPPGSPRRETVNQALLGLREDGTYHRLVDAYFD